MLRGTLGKRREMYNCVDPSQCLAQSLRVKNRAFNDVRIDALEILGRAGREVVEQR